MPRVLTPEQKARKTEYQRRYVEIHRERLRAQGLVYRKSKAAERAAKQRARYAAHPERQREYMLLKQYGMTRADYEAMVAQQDGTCAICKRPPRGRHRKDRVLHVDHDHDTGRVRGLLCTRCNTAVGLLDDDPTLMLAAAVYVAPAVSQAA